MHPHKLIFLHSLHPGDETIFVRIMKNNSFKSKPFSDQSILAAIWHLTLFQCNKRVTVLNELNEDKEWRQV